jgi:hypothetical protein
MITDIILILVLIIASFTFFLGFTIGHLREYYLIIHKIKLYYEPLKRDCIDPKGLLDMDLDRKMFESDKDYEKYLRYIKISLGILLDVLEKCKYVDVINLIRLLFKGN